jgi:hypothetical protein
MPPGEQRFRRAGAFRWRSRGRLLGGHRRGALRPAFAFAFARGAAFVRCAGFARSVAFVRCGAFAR